MNYVYSVTLGRNTGPNSQLTDVPWLAFRNRVGAYLEQVGRAQLSVAYFVETHEGHGVWDGIEEQSVKHALIIERELSNDWVNDLKFVLGQLATEYSQQAVALSIGTVVLIEAADNGV